MIKDLKLSGISQIEYKLVKDNFYLIEINPRIWSWHQIHSAAGVNLVSIYFSIVTNTYKDNREIVGPDKKVKAYWGFILIDLLHNVILNRNINLLEWILSILSLNYEAFFDFSDPLPFFIHLKETSVYIKNQMKINSSMKNSISN